MICRTQVLEHIVSKLLALEPVITCVWYSGTKLPCLLPKNQVNINHPSQFKQYCRKSNTVAEIKLHLKCYSGMVQISVQAVTPKPHTETFLKFDLEYEKSISKKKSGELRKQHNSNVFYMFFISS